VFNSDETTVTLLEAIDLFAAFTYDTERQNEGMHIIDDHYQTHF
jgi:hypothetical protein